MEQRQKQIDMGKKTPEYASYIAKVQVEDRKQGEPHTPRIEYKCSKRSFDGQVRKWRRALHEWDTQQIAALFRKTKIFERAKAKSN
jgi:histone RNA hairpin-binding protein